MRKSKRKKSRKRKKKKSTNAGEDVGKRTLIHC
jgi:hypothetical protein